MIPGGHVFAVFGSATQTGAESYVFGQLINPISTGIDLHAADEQVIRDDDAIYTLQGVRLKREPARGIYIKGGKKYLK